MSPAAGWNGKGGGNPIQTTQLETSSRGHEVRLASITSAYGRHLGLIHSSRSRIKACTVSVMSGELAPATLLPILPTGHDQIRTIFKLIGDREALDLYTSA